MGFKLLSLGSRWFIRIFFFEIDPPPQKKTRKSRKNCRANLSLKKVMVQPIFTWLQPFGPVKITPKTPAPNRPIVRPLRIWNSELPSYLREIFWTKIHPRWPTRKSRGNLKWKNKKIQQPGPSSFEMPEKMCQFTMTLAGFSLSNPTGRCWSSKLHLSSMAFIASGTFQTKEKNRKRVINIIWDAPAIVFTTQIISILDWVITILTPTPTTGILRGEILTCQNSSHLKNIHMWTCFFPEE